MAEPLPPKPHSTEQRLREALSGALPKPTASFRRRAWLRFEHALDPLGKPHSERSLRRALARGRRS